MVFAREMIFRVGVLVGTMKKSEIFFQYAEMVDNQCAGSGVNAAVVMFSAKTQHKNNKTPTIRQWLYI